MTGQRAPVGCIADDITGATDLASALRRRGLETRIAFGADAVPTDGADAVVVALKIRSVPAATACSMAVEAAEALRTAGARQLFSKYCSTFDSTSAGNIGPVADALVDLSDAPHVVHCPSYPANGRTVYLGHLFVGDQLLSESPMRNHPLNPMRDSQLQRVLAEQTRRGVALVRLSSVASGLDAVLARLAEIADAEAEAHHVIADAVADEHVETLATATAGDRLAAGGAAYGGAFAAAALARHGHVPRAHGAGLVLPPGPAAILAGSLSRATREQVRSFDGTMLTLSVAELVDGDAAVDRALALAGRGVSTDPLLIATERDAVAAGVGPDGLAPAEASLRIELAMGRIAAGLVQLGVRRLIVAGGETSGAVAQALALRSARIGPDISVGVPWVVAEDRGLAVAFKSGNFGGPSFFRHALEVAST